MKQLFLVLSFMITLSAIGVGQTIVFLDDEYAVENLSEEAKRMHDLDRANPVHRVALTGQTSSANHPSDDYAFLNAVLRSYADRVQEHGNSNATLNAYFSEPLFNTPDRLSQDKVDMARDLVLSLVTSED